MNTEASHKIFTLPNLITFIRLLLVPLFALLLLVYENNVVAFALFLVAALTDFLDGAVARATGQISLLGQRLDPLVDRLLILTAVITVYVLGRIPLWVLLLLVARDLSMLVLMVQLRATKLPEFKVAFVGKLATACNMVGFCLLILDLPVVGGLSIIELPALPGLGSTEVLLGVWFVYCGTILAWAAGIHYLVRAYRMATRMPPRGASGVRVQPNEASDKPAQAQSRGASGKPRQPSGSWLHDTAPKRQGSKESNTQLRKPNKALNKTDQMARTTQTHVVQKQNARQNKGGQTFGKTQPQRQGRAATATLLNILNTPKKKGAAVLVALFILVSGGFYSFDAVHNFGVIHANVRVGTVSVGHMEEGAAAELLSAELSAQAASAPVVLYASEEARAAGVTETTQELANGVATYDQNEESAEATSWNIGLLTLDAEADGEGLAKEAYAVGRGGDFLLGRFAASLLGAEVRPRLVLSAERLRSLEGLLTRSLGTPMQNAGIEFAEEGFAAYGGLDGVEVDEERFEELLQEAFFSGGSREIVVPMVERKQYVTLADAEQVAERVQAALAEPVSLRYGEETWELLPSLLGQVTRAQVEMDEANTGHLVPGVDAQLLQTKLPELIGTLDEHVEPQNAKFVAVDGVLQITPDQEGQGVDYPRLAADLNALLFAEETSDTPEASEPATAEIPETPKREVFLHIGALEPPLTTSGAEAYGFSTKISEYTIEYPWVTQGTITNIHVASDLINSSIISPQGTWSFNETAGKCTAEQGFVEASIILGDEYVDEIGGGVCNVATAVFNAAYEAGYPIAERVNHSLRMYRYPVGRDAAIAYPYADLKFTNDTEQYLLLTMSYTNTTVTCTLWGIAPGYVVESVSGELIEGADFEKKEVLHESWAPGYREVEQEGLKASTIEVTRTVYDAEGNLKEKRTFYSSYDATPEIANVGPKPDPKPEEAGAGTDSGAA